MSCTSIAVVADPLRLPYDEYADEARQALESGLVVIFQASTGSGKSLKFPLTCLEDALRRRIKPRIYTFIPLRMGVTGLYRFQSERGVLLQQEHGTSPVQFGYAAGKVYQYDHNTQVVYATTGHGYKRLLNVLSRCIKAIEDEDQNTASMMDDNNLGARVQQALQRMGTHFNIDEAHVQSSRENYLVISIMRYIRALPGYRRDQAPFLSILSATLEGSEILGFFPDSTVINKNAPRFQVHTHFPESAPANLLDEKARSLCALDCVCYLNQAYGDAPGQDILVFLSGMQAVDRMVDLCTQAPSLANCAVLRCYSQLSDLETELITEHVPMAEERAMALMHKHHLTPELLEQMGLDVTLQAMMSANRKIICATNMAESSVTISELRGVVDLLLEKTMVKGASADIRSLALRPISRASAKQRAGRVGRTQDGDYCPIATQQQFEALEAAAPNMFHEMDMSVSLLELLDAHLDPIQVLRIESRRNYYAALFNLLDLGLVRLRVSPSSDELCRGMQAILQEDETNAQLVRKWREDVIGNWGSMDDSRALLDEMSWSFAFALCNNGIVAEDAFELERDLLDILNERQKELLLSVVIATRVATSLTTMHVRLAYALYLATRAVLKSQTGESANEKPSAAQGNSLLAAVFAPRNIDQTDVARVLPHLGVPLKDGLLLYRMWQGTQNRTHLIYMAGLLAMLQGEFGYWFLPRKRPSEDETAFNARLHACRMEKHHLRKHPVTKQPLPSFRGTCDLGTLINVMSLMYRETEDVDNRGRPTRGGRKQLVEWSNAWSMNNKALGEARQRLRLILCDLENQECFRAAPGSAVSPPPLDDMDHAIEVLCDTPAWLAWLQQVKPALKLAWSDRRFQQSGNPHRRLEYQHKPISESAYTRMLSTMGNHKFSINNRVSFYADDSGQSKKPGHALWSYSQSQTELPSGRVLLFLQYVLY